MLQTIKVEEVTDVPTGPFCRSDGEDCQHLRHQYKRVSLEGGGWAIESQCEFFEQPIYPAQNLKAFRPLKCGQCSKASGVAQLLDPTGPAQPAPPEAASKSQEKLSLFTEEEKTEARRAWLGLLPTATYSMQALQRARMVIEKLILNR